MNAALPSWSELWAGMTDAYATTAATVLQLDTLGKGFALALVVTTATALAAAFTTDRGTSLDGPILTEAERY